MVMLHSKASFDEIKQYYEKHNQGHVLQYYEELTKDQKEALLDQLRTFDLEQFEKIVEATMKADAAGVGELQPPSEFQKLNESSEEQKINWEKHGYDALRKGQIGVLVLGGGAGTRLGFDGPKGIYDIGLPSKKTLFQLFAERVLRLRKLAGDAAKIPFIVMTSPINHDITTNYFKSNNYFGLPEEDMYFFQQGVLPCTDPDGLLLMDEKGIVATSPDGNGGIYPAMDNTGVLRQLRERGVHAVHVFSVDNALAKPADPLFCGFMVEKNADCGNKSIWKRHPEEKVGVVAMRDNKYCVAEYSEINEAQKNLRNDVGTLMFGAGNVCNHYFSLEFLQNTVLPNWNYSYHLAQKKIPCVDMKTGNKIKPTANNGLKFECFIFDVFPMSKNFGLIECEREEEFAPVKNAPGAAEDSPDTARTMINDLSRRWIEENGGKIAGDGLVEVDTALSYSGENLQDICKGQTFNTPLFLTA